MLMIMATGKKKKWKCVDCGSDKKGHYKDRCRSCYDRRQYKKKCETDPKWIEKKRKLAREFKRRPEQKLKTKARNKIWRTKNKKKFKFGVVKSQFKSLSVEERKLIMKDYYKNGERK